MRNGWTLRLSEWIRSSFAVFTRWSYGSETSSDQAVLDRIKISLDEALAAFGPVMDSGLKASQRIAEQDQQIASMLASKSWQLTSPLRRVAHFASLCLKVSRN